MINKIICRDLKDLKKYERKNVGLSRGNYINFPFRKWAVK